MQLPNSLMQQKTDLKPGLSLCMIVRDEEELLPGCLESARPVCDEMIVVDTGSEDQTPEIAESYGADVYYHEWQDSFSEARNYALQYPAHEWILQLDADERLIPEDYPKIRRAKSRNDVDGFYFYILNDLPGGGVGTFHYIRMYRNGQGTHYKGIVHNRLQFDGQAETTKIRIRHLGYALEEDAMEQKYRRSARLLQKQIEQHPEWALPRYYLCVKHISGNEYKQAIKQAKEALDRLDPDENQQSRLLYLSSLDHLAIAHQYRDEWRQADQALKQALDEDPEFIDALFDRAYNKWHQEALSEAESLYKQYFEVRDQWLDQTIPLRITLRSLESPHVAHYNLGMVLLKQNREEEAIQQLQQAIRKQEQFSPPYQSLAKILLNRNQLQKAYEYLQQGVDQCTDTSDLRRNLGTVCIRLKRFDEACEQLQSYIETQPEDPAGWNNLGLVRIQMNQPKKATNAFQKALKIQPDFQDAKQNLRLLKNRLNEE